MSPSSQNAISYRVVSGGELCAKKFLYAGNGTSTGINAEKKYPVEQEFRKLVVSIHIQVSIKHIFD